MHLKMSSAEVVCCKYLPSSTGELSIEANSVDPEQTAPIYRSSLIRVHTVCHIGFLNISEYKKSRQLFLRLVHSFLVNIRISKRYNASQ